MKTYPSIQYYQFDELVSIIGDKTIYAFDKLDGSNIRAEWSKQKGFYKFGSRKCMIDEKHLQFGEAVTLIKQTEEFIAEIFKSKKVDRAVCFYEFFGSKSKYGFHEDEVHQVSLIDISVYKKGMLDPKEFINWFQYFSIPDVLYVGKFNKEFYDLVKDGTLKNMGREGVVLKEGFYQKHGGPWMTKIKRNEWYEELKTYCKGDEKQFKLLS